MSTRYIVVNLDKEEYLDPNTVHQCDCCDHVISGCFSHIVSAALMTDWHSCIIAYVDDCGWRGPDYYEVIHKYKNVTLKYAKDAYRLHLEDESEYWEGIESALEVKK